MSDIIVMFRRRLWLSSRIFSQRPWSWKCPFLIINGERFTLVVGARVAQQSDEDISVYRQSNTENEVKPTGGGESNSVPPHSRAPVDTYVRIISQSNRTAKIRRDSHQAWSCPAHL